MTTAKSAGVVLDPSGSSAGVSSAAPLAPMTTAKSGAVLAGMSVLPMTTPKSAAADVMGLSPKTKSLWPRLRPGRG